MDKRVKPTDLRRAGASRGVTIKDLAAELDLSITTISRALNGYPDVGEKTRLRVSEAARRMGYRPNRNAQRLVTRRTHNLAWVQSDNDRKFVDPHFIEVMAGVLRGARTRGYDIVMAGETPDRQIAAYDRFVNDQSIDGFILDLPSENDPRITYLLEAESPFVVHGREGRHQQYGWVDTDNHGIFYKLTRLMIANGHRHIAFINGDERFTYALYRRHGVMDALADAGLGEDAVTVLNSHHPMGHAGFTLTCHALGDPRVTAIIYSSTLMAVEGHAAIVREGGGRSFEIATMDDGLNYIDLSPFAGQFSYARASLRDAGIAIVSELIRQCETGAAPQGHDVPVSWDVLEHLDARVLNEPVPPRRRLG